MKLPKLSVFEAGILAFKSQDTNERAIMIRHLEAQIALADLQLARLREYLHYLQDFPRQDPRD